MTETTNYIPYKLLLAQALRSAFEALNVKYEEVEE
jgi:hypothetical protein